VVIPALGCTAMLLALVEISYPVPEGPYAGFHSSISLS